MLKYTNYTHLAGWPSYTQEFLQPQFLSNPQMAQKQLTGMHPKNQLLRGKVMVDDSLLQPSHGNPSHHGYGLSPTPTVPFMSG